jgi:hypothetical protein
MPPPARLGEHLKQADARCVSILAVVPAFNETDNLPRVVADCPGVMHLQDIPVVMTVSDATPGSCRRSECAGSHSQRLMSEAPSGGHSIRETGRL